MRHGQSAGHHLVALYIHHDAATRTVVAPAVHHIRRTHRRHVSRPAIFHGQSIEVAAVFCGQLAQKRRTPQRLEAVCIAQRGQTAKQRVDKHQLAIGIQRHVVNVQITRGVAHLRQVQAVIAVLHLPVGEEVLKPPHLVNAAHVKTIGRRAQAHAAVERPLKYRQITLVLQTQ